LFVGVLRAFLLSGLGSLSIFAFKVYDCKFSIYFISLINKISSVSCFFISQSSELLKPILSSVVIESIGSSVILFTIYKLLFFYEFKEVLSRFSIKIL